MKTLSFCFILVLAVFSVSKAQTFYGVAGGLTYAGALSDANLFPDEHYTRPVTIQGSVGRQFGDWLAVRLDALVNHFAVRRTENLVDQCPMGVLCGSSHLLSRTFTNPLGVTAIKANMILMDPPPYAVQMYLIAGAGGYYFYQHPSMQGAVRPGFSVGAGFNVKAYRRSQVFVEGAYNRILGAPSGPTWLLPLTVGVRF